MNQRHSSKRIALAGIFTALGAAALFLENIMPTGKLGFYVFAGFVLSVVVMECGLPYGWLSFAAVSMIAFLIVPEKTAVLPYSIFFGLYSMVKNHVERLDKLVLEWFLKYAFFNLSLYSFWRLAAVLIPKNLLDRLPVYIGVILLQIAFFLFDWIFTLWTQFYLEKLQPKIRRGDS